MKANKIFYLTFLVLIIALLSKQWYNKNKISTCHKVTIATVIGGSGSFSTRRGLTYTYKYNSIQFSDSDGNIQDYSYFKDFKKYKNKKYFVKLSCDNPSISELIWDIEVPDTLKFIPIDGWSKIPYELK